MQMAHLYFVKRLLSGAIILVLLTGCSNTPDRANHSVLSIDGSSSVGGNNFSLQITRQKEDIQIQFSVLDSLDHLSMQHDPSYPQYFESLTRIMEQGLGHDSLQSHLNRLDSLRKIYSFFSTDSLVLSLSDHKAYENLFDSAFAEAESPVIQPGERIFIDGWNFHFNFSGKSGSRAVYAHSPVANYYPVLDRLLFQTLGYCRQKRPAVFSGRERTGGY